MADETAHAVRITIGIAIKDAVEPTEESSDRKSTRLNSSHSQISYAVFCLKKKKNDDDHSTFAHALTRTSPTRTRSYSTRSATSSAMSLSTPRTTGLPSLFTTTSLHSTADR